jgi:hypothetical protein
MPEIVDFPISSLANAPEKLRKLADDIEAGVYGDVECCAISLIGNKLYVFGFGPDSGHAATGMTLSAGAHRMLESLLEHGEDE